MMINIGSPAVPTYFKIRKDFKPITTLGRKYEQVDSGNWRAVDFGSQADVYRASVTFIGTFDDLSALLAEFDRDVTGGTRAFLTALCEPGEEIFGADTDYTLSMLMVVWKVGEITRNNLVAYEMPVTLQLLTPNPVSSSGSLSALRFHQLSYDGYTSYETNFSDTGGGQVTFTDHRDKDSGLFRATFRQTTEEMRDIRSFIRQGAGRASDFTWTIPDGIDRPFGPRQWAPYQVRIIDWKDNGKIFPNWWTISLTFAQEL